MPDRALQESSTSHTVTWANDATIQQYTDPRFDPVSLLNNSLPALSIPSVSSATPADPARSNGLSLPEVSTQAQAFLTKVNAQNVRSANTLSQLTDEILRCGSRLAYEVEVLRGDAHALQDSLTDSLREDIQKFTLTDTAEDSRAVNSGEEQPNGDDHGYEPEFIGQLRMLSLVKARLEEVINVLGEAMKWPLPPSELSLTSSLISVSAPQLGSQSQSQEDKGKEFAKKARAEVSDLLNDTVNGPDIEAATRKVEMLRSLSAVWKGTAEERARNKFVDSLSKLVEDKARQVQARSLSQPPVGTHTALPRSSSRPPMGPTQERSANETATGGGGLLRNLQRLRDEIYLD